MPISPSYSWEQTPTHIIVDVRLPHGALQASQPGAGVDVFCTDLFLKLHAHNTLLTLDLLRPVQPQHLHVAINRTTRKVQLRVPKQQQQHLHQVTRADAAAAAAGSASSTPPGDAAAAATAAADPTTSTAATASRQTTEMADSIWPVLCISQTQDKSLTRADIMARRQDSIQRFEALQAQKRKARREQHKKQDKFALEKDWDIDARQRENLSALKAKAQWESAQTIQQWQDARQEQSNGDEPVEAAPAAAASKVQHPAAKASEPTDATAAARALPDNDVKASSTPGPRTKDLKAPTTVVPTATTAVTNKRNHRLSRPLPPPRMRQAIQVTFTERPRNTPAREEKDIALDKEIAKVNKRKEKEERTKSLMASEEAKAGAVGDGLRNDSAVDVGETQILFLLDKARAFMRSHDMLACISACSSALELDVEDDGDENVTAARLLRARAFHTLAAAIRLDRRQKKSAPADTVAMEDAHLCRTRWKRCIKDCATIIDKLRSETERSKKNTMILCEAYGLRAAAVVALGGTRRALADFYAMHALQASPPAVSATDEGKTKAKVNKEGNGSEMEPLSEEQQGVAKGAKGDGSERCSLLRLSILSDWAVNARRTADAREKGMDRIFKQEADMLVAERKLDGAVEKYSEALGVNPNAVACLANRAAVLLQLGQHAECIVDCTLGLAILDDGTSALKAGGDDGGQREATTVVATDIDNVLTDSPVPYLTAAVAQRLRLRFLSRRGAARSAERKWRLARDDYAAACALSPSDDALRVDLEVIEHRLRSQRLYRRAETAFWSGKFDTALSVYTQVVKFTSRMPGGRHVDVAVVAALLSNRAACELSMARYAGCVTDCSRALCLLDSATEHGAMQGKVLHWKKLTLLRRGTALCWLGKLGEGLTDMDSVVALHDAEEERLKSEPAGNQKARDERAAWIQRVRVDCASVRELMAKCA